MPLVSDGTVPESPRAATVETMEFIKLVVRDTSRPSWMSPVPPAFGESKTGTLKADEWRSYSTIFLPIALVLLWGDASAHPNPDTAKYFADNLALTMSLVQAITLTCYRMTSNDRADRLQQHLKTYLTDLRKLYPSEKARTNQHVSLHLPAFLRLYGPVHSWWTYPFERLIGLLQQLPTNNVFGMPY